MFCTKCGKENSTEAAFCSGCGAPMRQLGGDSGASKSDSGRLQRAVRRANWIVWGLLFVALLTFVLIANVMGSDAGGFDEPFTLLKYMLYAIGVIVLTIAFVLRWAFRKWVRVAVLSDFLVLMLPGALCVAIGIYGLIVFITNNADFVSLYVLVSIAAVSLIFMRPRKEAK